MYAGCLLSGHVYNGLYKIVKTIGRIYSALYVTMKTTGHVYPSLYMNISEAARIQARNQ
jgi:hypothetical protein